MMNFKNKTHLLTLLNTSVTADPSAVISPLSMFGLFTWLSGRLDPRRSWPIRLGDGFFGMIAYLMVDVIHIVGHILSARLAQAPMDEVYVAAPLPRTLYDNDDVSPNAHRLRAVGGPIAGSLAAILSLLYWPLTQAGSAMRTAVMTFGLLNGLVSLGSLIPFPFVDGGVLLKWTLVERGQTPEQADRVVQQTNGALGSLFAGVGLIFALRRSWLIALGCFTTALLAIGVAFGKITK